MAKARVVEVLLTSLLVVQVGFFILKNIKKFNASGGPAGQLPAFGGGQNHPHQTRRRFLGRGTLPRGIIGIPVQCYSIY